MLSDGRVSTVFLNFHSEKIPNSQLSGEKELKKKTTEILGSVGTTGLPSDRIPTQKPGRMYVAESAGG